MEKHNLKPRIVIVGGGAGGMELATRLGHCLGKKNRADIYLIDHQLTHVWKPLLHEVAVGTLDSHQDAINYVSHAHQHHYHFILGKMTGIERSEKTITLAEILDENQQRLVAQRTVRYDELVIAVGSQANTFNVPGAEQHCYFLDSRPEADAFHSTLINKIIQMRQPHPQSQPQSLNIAIIGAGASGVELAAELVTALHQIENINLEQDRPAWLCKITLIEANKRILPALNQRLSEQVHYELSQLGVQILTQQRVTRISATEITTAAGLNIAATLKIGVAGIKAPSWLSSLDGLTTNSLHQLEVRPTLQTTEDNHIFALGDCCACPLTDNTQVPPRAQSENQQATLLCQSIQRQLKGKSLLEFKYNDRGSLIHLSGANSVGS